MLDKAKAPKRQARLLLLGLSGKCFRAGDEGGLRARPGRPEPPGDRGAHDVDDPAGAGDGRKRPRKRPRADDGEKQQGEQEVGGGHGGLV